MAWKEDSVCFLIYGDICMQNFMLLLNRTIRDYHVHSQCTSSQVYDMRTFSMLSVSESLIGTNNNKF